MKGKKTRIGIWLLAVTLLLGSFAGCGKENPSVLKLPDATAAGQVTVQETPAPLTPLGDRICVVGKETIPESTLFSFVLTEATFDPLMGLTLRLSSTNKSPARDFLVSLAYLSVNGYMQDAQYEAPVPAGQTVAGEILIPAETLRSSGVSSVEELILYPLIYDDTVPMGQGDVVDGAFSFYPTGHTHGTVTYPVRERTSTEQTFFDNGFASMVILSAQADEAEELSVRCYLENKTDRFLSFDWSDAAVNGTPVSYSGDTVVAPGMRRYVTAAIPAGELLNAGSNEVTFKVTATPLSNTGSTLSPLMEQRGTYRFSDDPTADPGTGGDNEYDPDDEPGMAMVTASPEPTAVIYTTPTSAQKRNAKNGYVNKDKVNMRSGPGTQFKTVGKKIDQNSTVTLYELQNGWWFLKCGSKYGYVRADFVSQGKPKSTAAPTTEDDDKSFAGTVNTQSVAALRKSADTDSKCLKELSDGAKLTVYYKTKGKDGHVWYYVTAGKTKGYIRSDLVRVSGKVPSK